MLTHPLFYTNIKTTQPYIAESYVDKISPKIDLRPGFGTYEIETKIPVQYENKTSSPLQSDLNKIYTSPFEIYTTKANGPLFTEGLQNSDLLNKDYTAFLSSKESAKLTSSPQDYNLKPQIWIDVNMGAVLINGTAISSFWMRVEPPFPASFYDSNPSWVSEPENTKSPASINLFLKKYLNLQLRYVNEILCSYCWDISPSDISIGQ